MPLRRFAALFRRPSAILLTFGLAFGAYSLTWTHLAGSPGGAGWEDGTGAEARFKGLAGVAADTLGNVFVADTLNHTIRKVSVVGVTTVAGFMRSAGSTNGRGAAATFNRPTGIAIDGAGTLYVADTYNHAIRKISATGEVTTLAGLLGTQGNVDATGSAARFRFPQGVAVDSSGNVYVADTGNHNIRMIGPGGVVSTIAGTGTGGFANGTGTGAQFKSPAGLAVDPSGATIHVADSGNSVIRQINMPSAAVSTLAGTPGVQGHVDTAGGAPLFFTPAAIARNDAGILYVADSGDHSIRMIDGGTVSTYAGAWGAPGSADGTGIAASFRQPQGVAADPSGNVFVGDTGNHTLRKIAGGAVVTTVGGLANQSGSTNDTGTNARFNAPQGVTVAWGGSTIYVADTSNNAIRKITSAGVTTLFAGGTFGSADGNGASAQFKAPRGVAWAPNNGNVYVADTNNHTIRQITPAGDVTIIAGLAGSPGSTNDVGTLARFNFPQGIACDKYGDIYVADTNNFVIRKIDMPAASVTTFAGTAGMFGTTDGNGSSARFGAVTGIAVDFNDTIWVTESMGGTVRKITQTGDVTTPMGTPSFNFTGVDGQGNDARFGYPGPSGIAAFFGYPGPAGTSGFIADPGAQAIRSFTSAHYVSTAGGKSTEGYSGASNGTGAVASFSNPRGMALDTLGNAYAADTGNNAIRMGTPTIDAMPTVDKPYGPTGQVRQLNVVGTATMSTFEWRIVRKPASSSANLSATNIQNPTFTPDVQDLFVFRCKVTGPAGKSEREIHLWGTGPTVGFSLGLGWTGYPAPLRAGDPAAVTVIAIDSNGHPTTGYTGTVSFTHNDPNGATLPGNYTFTGADNGVYSFPVSFTTAGGRTVTVTDSVNGLVNSTGTNVVANAFFDLALTAPATAAAGTPFTVTVTARDFYNNPVPDFTGTVHFSSSAGGAILPPDYTFSPGDAGVHTFTSGVTLPPGNASETITVALAGGGADDTKTVNLMSIANVFPNRSGTLGGPSVVITGTNLAGASSVSFGGTPATVTFNDSTSVIVNAPAHAAGLVDIVIVTSSGTVTLTNGFTYATPNGDFGADGRADLMWRNQSTGENALWQMNGLTTTSATFLPSAGGWTALGIGDFNGDSRADLLWRSPANEIAVWVMNGSAITTGAIIAVLPSEWTLQGIGDFSGDLRADILWRNSSTSAAVVWLMDGTTISSTAGVASPSSEWTVQGVGDFNTNGRADILWRNSSTNDTVVWLMNGTSIASTGYVATPPPEWQTKGVGDFNGDGRADIVWRNSSTLSVVVWLMNGTSILSTGAIATPDANWDIRAVSDFDGNSSADMVWRNNSNGQNAMWLMNGTSIASAGFITTVPDLNWTIVGPR